MDLNSQKNLRLGRGLIHHSNENKLSTVKKFELLGPLNKNRAELCEENKIDLDRHVGKI